MTRNDLEVGMVVKMRDGSEGVIALDQDKRKVLLYKEGFDMLATANLDLTWGGMAKTRKDIVEIWCENNPGIWSIPKFFGTDTWKEAQNYRCIWSRVKTIVIDGKTIEISQESFEALRKQLV